MNIEDGRLGTGRVGDPARLDALAATGLTGEAWVPAFDRLTALVTRLLRVPVALVSLVESDRQCFVSHVGLGEPLASQGQTPLSHSYCRFVVETGATLVVPDAREHELLRDNPAIVEYSAIAYLGAPVRTPTGQVLGSLCALDTEVRHWSASDVEIMEDLAAAASAEIAARLAAHEAAAAAARTQRILDTTQDAFIALNSAGRVTAWNRAAEVTFGWSELEALGRPLSELIIPEAQRGCHEQGLGRVSDTGCSRLSGQLVELTAAHRGGREFPVEVAMTAVQDPDGTTYHAFLRDISGRKRSQQLRDVEHAVSQALLSAPSAEEAAASVLARVGEGIGWQYAEYWRLESGGRSLARLAAWAADPAVASAMGSVGTCGPDEGMIGPVLSSGQALWTAGATLVPCRRTPVSDALGLRTCVAVPVHDGTDIDGVLLVFDRREHAGTDTELMASLQAVSGHIGQFMHRRRAVDLHAELARTREGFDRAIANITDHLWTVRALPDGGLEWVYSSSNAGQVFGGEFPAGNDILPLLIQGVHDEDTDDFGDFYRALTVEEQRAEVECRITGPDGRTRWIWLRAAPRREGDELYVDGVSTDVSDRRRAAAALRQQAELLELAPAAIIVRDLDDRITFWNPAAEAMYGWETSSALGCVTHRLLDTVFPVSHHTVDEALRTAGRWEGELDHLRADGTRITVLSRQAVQYDGAGSATAILEFNLDVTDRRRTERELADSEERLRTQFSLATVGQVTMGLDGRFMQLNPAFADMLGRSADELHRLTIDDVTHPDDRVGNRRTAARLFAGDEVSTDRHQRLLHAGGDTVEAHIGMSLVRDRDGRPRSFVAVIQDVTARLAAERERDAAAAELAERNRDLQGSNEQLAAANMLKLDLMGMLSHEIGNPLNTITGYTEMLLDDPDVVEGTARQGIAAIQRAAWRLATLRDEVLAMCAVDADRMHAQPVPVDLATALDELQQHLETDIPVSCPTGLRVLVHPAHLQQILTNFVTNAAKYGGGAIAITGSAPPPGSDRVTVSVHDDGPGVPEELRERLFDRYTRADATRAVSGHGLGLYIVKGLAEANGGSVHHTPRLPTGSTFSVELRSA